MQKNSTQLIMNCNSTNGVQPLTVAANSVRQINGEALSVREWRTEFAATDNGETPSVQSSYHIPVLVEEVVFHMNLKPKGIYVDCTLGGAGHSYAMLSKEPSIELYCFDRDEEAIRYSQKRLIPFKKQVHLINDNFSNFRTHLALNKISKVDGILMDLGVSNHQISNTGRGFSFMHDEKLDMRMTKSQSMSAYDLVNTFEIKDLISIFQDLGEERYSKRIANNIVKQRSIKEIETTRELANIIEKSVPDKSKLSLTKSKARIFQAIRIVINDELKILHKSINDAISALNPQGRLLIISWHSLEDRIVKEGFNFESTKCICPIELPVCACNHRRRVKLVSKKAITPSENEIKVNNNSRSAKLRIIEKL